MEEMIKELAEKINMLEDGAMLTISFTDDEEENNEDRT